MSPFGFVVDGTEDEVIVEKEKGLVWTMAAEWEDEKWDAYREKIDEYGLGMSNWTWGQ